MPCSDCFTLLVWMELPGRGSHPGRTLTVSGPKISMGPSNLRPLPVCGFKVPMYIRHVC